MNHPMPAVRVVLLFIIGIITAVSIPLPTLSVYSLCWGIVLFLLLTYRYASHKLWYSIVLQVLFVLIGYCAHRSTLDDRYLRRLKPLQKNEMIKIFGTIQTHPQIQNSYTRFVVSVDSVERIGWFGGSPKSVIVYYWKNSTDSLLLQRGQRGTILGRIQEFPYARNPGEFDWGRYLELENIDGIITAESIHIHPNDTRFSLTSSVMSVQEYFYEILDSLHNEEVAGFLKGLLLGNREYITRDVKQMFVDTGTIHILAVSGTHVGVVALIFYALFTMLRLPRRAVAVASMLALLFYMVITGMSPSVCRATIMAIVVLLGMCFERPVNIYNSLAVAGLILLVFDTTTLFSTGAQLSFAAVFSIVYFYPKLTSRFQQFSDEGWLHRGVKGIVQIFAVSCAAQLGTIPFTAFYFGRISLVSFLANILVVPLAGLLIVLGFVELSTAQVSIMLASTYAEVTNGVYALLQWIVRQGASVPFASLPVGSLALSEVVLYFLVILGLSMPKKWFKYSIIVILIIANSILYVSLFTSTPRTLKSIFFDVGQGDACFLEFPEGTNVLIDAGPRSRTSDAGKRILVPYFQKNNIHRIHYAVLTHPHDDHYGGILSIANSLRIDTIVVPMFDHYPEEFEKILEELQNKGAYIRKVGMGEQLYPSTNCRCYVLSPSRAFQSSKNINNSSLVLKIVYKKKVLLFTGDAEREVERALVQRYSDFLRADLLKVGHHGSKSSTSELFLDVVQPGKAMISVGEKNTFGHPSEIVLERLRNRNIVYKLTSHDHAVYIVCPGERFYEEDWRK